MHHLRCRADATQEAALYLSCKRWCCPACAERKKQELAECLASALASLGDEPVYIWRGSTDSKGWETMRKAIQRAWGKYFAVEHGPDRSHFLVLTTVPVLDAVAFTASDAFASAVAAMRDIPSTKGKPVSSSRGWLKKAAKAFRWAFLGRVAVTPEELQPRLEAERERDTDFSYHLWEPSDSIHWGASFRFPEKMPDAARAIVRARLFGTPLSLVFVDSDDEIGSPPLVLDFGSGDPPGLDDDLSVPRWDDDLDVDAILCGTSSESA